MSSVLETILFSMNRAEPIRQASLLLVLASGSGHGDSLLEGLRSHAAESGSPWSDRVNSLRILLEQGQPLSTALSNNPGLLPETTIAAVRVGEQTGSLAEVLADEAIRLSDSAGTHRVVGFSLGNLAIWTMLVGVTMIGVLSFIIIFIVPKFKKIFEDFDTELPATTVLLVDLSDFMVSGGIIFLLPLLAMIAAIAILRVQYSIRMISKGSPPLSQHWLRFWSPELLRMLSITAASSQPLINTVHSFGSQLVPGRAATQLSGVRFRLENGEAVETALKAEGFITGREEAFLMAAGKSGHLDWAMKHLGRSIETRRFRWLGRLLNVFEPCVLLGFGLVVMFVVVSMFMPLVKLLNDLS
ncbi:MAG: type II secretion system F family protein [Planctomycetaceae bacterium]|nr:type II secretion system F family protein [Planctomycetaceae bacterium]